MAAGKHNAKRLGAHLVFADESGFQLTPSIAATWAPVGHTPTVHHVDRRDRISVITGISVSSRRQRLNLHFQLYTENIRQLQARDFPIVNPRDGAPLWSRRAAWVSAPRQVLAEIGRKAGVEASAAAVADALATAFMISQAVDIEAYCRKRREVEAWVLEGELLHFPATERARSG